VYRGGRRPIDLYWRIHVGVPGSNMPANYPALNSEQIWDVVNFLQVLPYRSELRSSTSSWINRRAAGRGALRGDRT
jgi:mono/diheme cytochrome c family protein